MTTPTRSSTPIQVKIAEAILGKLAQFLVGIVFMGAGGWLVHLSTQTEPHNTLFFWTGVSGFVFGGLCFPSIFPIAKNVYVTVFPNGIPILGGRRISDPPADQPEVKP